MGLLRDLTATQPTGAPGDVGPLRDLISAIVTADGSVDVAEHVTVEALYETIPQLRAATTHAAPPAASRKALLASLGKITEPRLRAQLFVLAVDLALASEGASDHEDAFVSELQKVLDVDDSFATQVITVLAYKYGRAR